MVGMPLGVRPDVEYSPLVSQMGPGDCVVFCSDGIAETRNRAGELYGLAPTAAAVADTGSRNFSAQEMVDSVIGSVTAFAANRPQQDDRTVVVLQANRE